MARAHAASACVQSDSIKGLAQSIAKPAYHRLLVAEPALRRAVPTLIIAFLITICLGAFVQVVDQNRQKRATMKRDLAAVADLLTERLDRITSVRQDRAANRALRAAAGHPSWGRRRRPPSHRPPRRPRVLAMRHDRTVMVIPPHLEAISAAWRCPERRKATSPHRAAERKRRLAIQRGSGAARPNHLIQEKSFDLAADAASGKRPPPQLAC